MVGSIAQWESNHVAHVESVTADAIETTDDSWGGTTTRRRYLRGQSDWPSNFLHIKDLPVGGTSGAAADSTAVEYGGAVHTFFYDSSLGNLRHAWSSPTSGWQFENLDGDPGSIGHWNADTGRITSVTAYGGGLQVFYYDATYGNLRHAWTTSTGWSFENLDGDPGSTGHWNADLGFEPAVVTYAGSLQVFYYDATNGNLRHAWATSTGWSFENLDGDPGSIGHWNADVGRRSTAVVHNGSLQVLYYDATNGNLRHAWTTSTGWSFENLDGDVGSLGHRAGDLGATQAATLYGDSLQVFYPDGTGNTLRHAWSSPSSGWQFEDLVTLAG